MNIIGVSAFYHESACCLIRDGKLEAMVAEERFSRLKHDQRLPTQAYRYCLNQAGLHPGDIDCIAYYEMPETKLARQLSQPSMAGAASDLGWLDCWQPLNAIRDYWGFRGDLRCFPHHLSHAASSFYFSGFEQAAILVVDGVGEWATTSYGYGDKTQLTFLNEVHFPHSIGLWYAALTAYLGFRVNDGEYKVMGLAPYGKPMYLNEMRTMLKTQPGPGFQLDLKYFDYVSGQSMFSVQMEQLLGQPARKSGDPITEFHQDVARSLQAHLEAVLLEKATYLHGKTGSSNLCIAGGVGLNCVANGRLRRESPFEKVFVQPAAGDDGGCLGAAALAHIALCGTPLKPRPLSHTFYGPAWSNDYMVKMLRATGIRFCDFRQKEAALIDQVVQALLAFKIVGIFHGRMEMGPRALGSRSILANPMDSSIRDRLNKMVKKRESFRPFAPSVLVSEASNHFELDQPSPFMLETCKVRSPLNLPGITHVDGSARPQTVDPRTAPRFAKLVASFFQQSGCPILVNTSFNLRGEPIVCTPADALRCGVRANLDMLVLGDFVVEAKDWPRAWAERAEFWPTTRQSFPHNKGDSLVENLYSFV